MSRGRKPKINRNPFIQFTFKMINSRAYKELPASSSKGLPFFLAKVKRPINDPQRYLEIFSLSYEELKRATKFSDATCSKVFRDLVRFGFIDPVSKGGLRGHGKSFSQYKLSTRWEQYGHADFREIDLKRFGT